ncbi:hypothetical protein IKG33_00980 [Candidatus Saccharibacteria bacterium]|nr:hypothetical protein [Candidatus Saccharibacteria bacterium]
MIRKRESKMDLKGAIFGCLFLILGFFTSILTPVLSTTTVYAVPENTVEAEVEVETEVEPETRVIDADEEIDTILYGENGADQANESKKATSDQCKNSLGAVGWLVCPITEKISDAVDWIYDRIETILIINPISMEDGSPIYEIWKYCLGLTNIVFIIFLLVVIYSQITGLGISNYGIKKVLPKLIVVAILVNLSFLICSIAIDISNIVGSSLRGTFEAVETAVMENYKTEAAAQGITFEEEISYAGTYSALVGGGTLGVGALAIGFETGAIWLLIPTVLGAIVSVATGLITIALRQAVVVLLVMISPLAIVAYMLPNVDRWFKKWRALFDKMLIFYPMFSLLFGASSLAGFAIMMGMKNGFGVILGLAVQIFPLFYSWSLMKMSGTFLETINAKIQGYAAGPLATNRAWAESHRQLSKYKHLAAPKVYTPSLRLAQFLSNRKVAREEETNEHMLTVKNRGLAYNASRKYRNNIPTKEAEEEYEAQARNMRYMKIVERHKDNMNKGLGSLEAVQALSNNSAKKMRLHQLDVENVKASDSLKMERARGAMIEYENAKGFQKRVSDAVDAHMDTEVLRTGETGTRKLHNAITDANMERYNEMKEIMEGKAADVHFIGADASHAFNAQSKVVAGKFQDYFNLTAPTQDVVHRLNELTKSSDSSNYIDAIVAGMRTLNLRGDTDLIRKQVTNILADKKLELGTYASQSLASFLMFDVKGNDPFLRRLGKYINLETARMYNDLDDPNKRRRTRKDVSMYEYVNGEYIDEDEDGHVIREADGSVKMGRPKRGAAILMKGTSFKDMERTAIADMIEGIRENSVDPETGAFDYERFKKNEKAIWDAIMPNIIGDQFSFLSGSEQIIALSKGITGVDLGKHKIDWEGIFGKDIARQLTEEQKEDYINNVLKERTKTFLGGHVPVQIAKTKTDMLESIKSQYALLSFLTDKDGNIVPERLRELEGNTFGDRPEDGLGRYEDFENRQMDGIKEKFVDSFKPDALKGFVKMQHRGYQGESKDGLIQLINPDKLYEQYFGNGKNNVEKIFNQYRISRNSDVRGFWREAEKVLVEEGLVEDAVTLNDMRASLPSYTSVDQLYEKIMEEFFGGI